MSKKSFTEKTVALLRQAKATSIEFSELPITIQKSIQEAILLRKVDFVLDYQGEYGIEIKDWLIADSDQMKALTKNPKFQGFESNGEGKFHLFFRG